MRQLRKILEYSLESRLSLREVAKLTGASKTTISGYHTAIFVAGIDHLEEDVHFFFREILVTDFIDEDQMRFSQPDSTPNRLEVLSTSPTVPRNLSI